MNFFEIQNFDLFPGLIQFEPPHFLPAKTIDTLCPKNLIILSF